MMNFMVSLFASVGAYVLTYILTLLIADKYPVMYHSVVPILLILAVASFFGGVTLPWYIGLNVMSIVAVYYAKRRKVVRR
jgi:hypothetical protein